MLNKYNYLKDSLLYVSPQIAGKVISIITLPIILFLLDKNTYGEIALLLSIQQILASISSYGSRQTILKFYATADNASKKLITKFFKKFNLKITFLIFLFLFLINNYLLLKFSNQIILYLSIGIALIAHDALTDSILVANQKAKQNSVTNISLFTITPLFLIIALNFQPSSDFYLLSTNFAFFIKIVITNYYISQIEESGSETINISEVKLFTKNMFSINFSQKVIKWSDRLLVGIFLGDNKLAEYHAVLQLVLALEYISNGLTTALKPLIFNKITSKEESEELLNNVLKLIFLFSLTGVILRFNLGNAILPREYWDYLDYIPFIAFSILIASTFKLLTIFADSNSNQINHTQNSFVSSLLSVLSCFIGLKLYGVIGLIIAGIITGVVRLSILIRDKNFVDIPKIDYKPFVYYILTLLLAETLSHFLSFSGSVTLRWFVSILFFSNIGFTLLKLKLISSKLN